jgi:predicted nucleic acid-binding protein
MKCVVDTNILFSAVYNLESNAGRLLFLAVEEKVELFAPEYVKSELVEKLEKKLCFSVDEVYTVITSLPVKWIEDEIFQHMLKKAKIMIPDEKDVPILACALALDMGIITGDRDFHQMKDKDVEVWRLRDMIEQSE